MDLVRLACVRHAASVRPEPGSNSPSRFLAESEDPANKSESRLEKALLRTTATTRSGDLAIAYC